MPLSATLSLVNPKMQGDSPGRSAREGHLWSKMFRAVIHIDVLMGERKSTTPLNETGTWSHDAPLTRLMLYHWATSQTFLSNNYTFSLFMIFPTNLVLRDSLQPLFLNQPPIALQAREKAIANLELEPTKSQYKANVLPHSYWANIHLSQWPLYWF